MIYGNGYYTPCSKGEDVKCDISEVYRMVFCSTEGRFHRLQFKAEYITSKSERHHQPPFHGSEYMPTSWLIFLGSEVSYFYMSPFLSQWVHLHLPLRFIQKLSVNLVTFEFCSQSTGVYILDIQFILIVLACLSWKSHAHQCQAWVITPRICNAN